MATKKANKKVNKRPVKKTAKKQVKSNGNGWLDSLLKAAVSLILMYFFVSWAIDSGSIAVYVLAFLGFYYGVHYIIETIKELR